MPRRFLDDIRADVNTLKNRAATDFPDNNIGSITPAVLRTYQEDSMTLRIDEIDSQKQDEAFLIATTDQLNVSIGANWTTLTTYDVASGDDSAGQGFLKVNQAGGIITTKDVSGWTYKAAAFVSFEGAGNVRYDLAIMANGVPVGFIGSTTGEGAADPVSVAATHTDPSTQANTEFSIAMKTDSAGDIDIFSAVLEVTIMPTNNAS